MVAAQALSRFDQQGIDLLIDGSALGVVKSGDRMRLHITGKLQQYIGGAIVALFIILAIVIFI